MSDAELSRNLRQVFWRALVMLRRCARDHFQIRDLRQARQDFILNAVGKISIGLVFASIFKRKHRDALLGNCYGCNGCFKTHKKETNQSEQTHESYCQPSECGSSSSLCSSGL